MIANSRRATGEEKPYDSIKVVCSERAAMPVEMIAYLAMPTGPKGLDQ
eukprot:CAMPEP_0196782324 /NCGR_PEP_ID=MMETSP1104-20130614/11277_1 /TAXON_ID=33652 /ORGANISM="Cafeteria sp., Strain Caron Lab Isolate" /LENGTH=47 /DNA_ID= /DNA_START= /DNA_END= /DNA_ORIENTATION=